MTGINLFGGESVQNIEEANVPLKQFVRIAEREYILRILAKNRGNRAKTARDLRIGRSTFYVKLKELSIN
ncbi:hypothetical protein KKA47_00650 [bacterium]|nr:hypothetical protein [bacterium]